MNVAVIILVGQEKLHIRRCIEKLAPLQPKCVYLVTSQPDDGTVAIAQETAAASGLELKTLHHDWPGLYAEQYNWAAREIAVKVRGEGGGWILRLDADEYLYPETIEEIKTKLPMQDDDVTGVIFKRRHVIGWLGDRWVKRGMYPVKLLRLYRIGCGVCEERQMDEHIKLLRGRAVEFDGDFADHNLNSLDWWKKKHRGYAKREANDALEIMSRLKACDMSEFEDGDVLGSQAMSTRRRKYRYYSTPPYLRVLVYWAIRFFLRGAILEGPPAWRWCWYHALWYRWLVDREILKIQKLRG